MANENVHPVFKSILQAIAPPPKVPEVDESEPTKGYRCPIHGLQDGPDCARC